jgi:hypothetical protein
MAGEYGAQGGIGTGIGELASMLGPIPGIGQAMLAGKAIGDLAVWGIPKLDRMISGPSRYLQEIPTAEIVAGYNKGPEGWGAGGVAPVWAELQRRGATTGLTPPTQQQIDDSYKNWADQGSWGWA